MKKISLLLLSFILTTSLFLGCANNMTLQSSTNKETNLQDSSNLSNKDLSNSVSKNISIDESKKLIHEGKVDLILDVRDEKDFAKGHLKNAIQIPVKNLKDNLGYIEKFKDKLVLVYCTSGKKSAKAIEILKENGFKNLVHMKDGISKWDGEVEK